MRSLSGPPSPLLLALPLLEDGAVQFTKAVAGPVIGPVAGPLCIQPSDPVGSEGPHQSGCVYC